MQQLRGPDLTTGFRWPLNAGFDPHYTGLHLIPYNSDPLSKHFFNRIETATGHTGASTNALFLAIEGYPSPSCCAQETLQTSGMAHPLKEVYYRFWEKLPSSTGKFLSTNSSFYWRTGISYKTLNDYRIHLDFNTTNSYKSLHPHMHADAGGINASNDSPTACPYTDPITGDLYHDCSVRRAFADVDNNAITIPIDRWFLIEVYFKRSIGSDGRYLTAIKGQTVAATFGANYGVDFEEIRDMYWVSLYSVLGDSSQWIEDLEIWDSPPCSKFPCGSGRTTTYTGPLPPFITNRVGAVGKVGLRFSFQITATNRPTYYDIDGTLPAGLSINHKTGLISGTPITPARKICSLQVRNSIGKSAQWMEFEIEPRASSPPTISSFRAMPESISPGQWSQLRWVQNGATSLSIDQEVGDVTGANPFPVQPRNTIIYTLTARNSAGSTRASTTVRVTHRNAP